MENPANYLEPQRWGRTVPVSRALGAIPGPNHTVPQHDIKFEEDNWEAPTLSAWGVGWQVMLDGLEITQFTYFQ